MASKEPEVTRVLSFQLFVAALIVVGAFIGFFWVAVGTCTAQKSYSAELSKHTTELKRCRADTRATWQANSVLREERAIALNIAYNMAGIAHREILENPDMQSFVLDIPDMRKQLAEMQAGFLGRTDTIEKIDTLDESKDYEE